TENVDLVELKYLEESRHPWELARLEVVFKLLKKQLKDREKIKLLDVGSGDGYFIREICHRIKNTEAVAVDTEYTEDMLPIMYEANKETGDRVKYFRTLDDAPAQDYDLVFLLDVIEHV